LSTSASHRRGDDGFAAGDRRRSWTTGRAIALGTLAVGVLDALDAVVFFGMRGAPPGRVFQGIAGGLLGRASFEGGVPTVLLGVTLHFVVACGIVSTYVIVSRRVEGLRARPWLFGIPYGVVAYFAMNRIVIPLSAIGHAPAFSFWPFVNGILIHALVIGPVSALAASRIALRRNAA
jgi:hypothetical protein